MTQAASKLDFDKYRLRNFVDRLIQAGEVEIHDKPVPLTGLSPIIERTEKAVLFKKAGPEQVEMVAKTAGNRKRLAAAFETTEEKLYDEYFKRLANPQPLVEVPSGDAPVHEMKITGKDVDLTKLPFHPQHAYRRQLLHEFRDRLHDRPGDGPAQCRLPPPEPAQPLRSRHQRHGAVRPQAHLHRLRGARPETADHVHGRRAPARFFCRDHAPARRRAGAGRPASAASRRRW